VGYWGRRFLCISSCSVSLGHTLIVYNRINPLRHRVILLVFHEVQHLNYDVETKHNATQTRGSARSAAAGTPLCQLQSPGGAVRLSTRTFNVSGSRIWNGLPEDVVSAPTLSSFRRLPLPAVISWYCHCIFDTIVVLVVMFITSATLKITELNWTERGRLTLSV